METEIEIEATFLLAAVLEAAGGEVEIPVEHAMGKGLSGDAIAIDFHAERNVFNVRLEKNENDA